jgi:hypothetical protein
MAAPMSTGNMTTDDSEQILRYVLMEAWTRL